MTTDRAELCNIINNLPDEAIHAIRDYLIATEKVYDRLKMQVYLANIPEEETEISKEERVELDKAAAEPGGISLEDFKKELGL